MKLFLQIKEAFMLKKNITVSLLMLAVFTSSGQLTVAQTAEDYDALSMRPGIYEGVSDARPSEAAALLDARNDGYRNLAASFSFFTFGRYKITMAGNGTNLTDMLVSITGDASVTVRLPLTGVEEVAKKVERTEEGYKAKVLIRISQEGRVKADKYVDREMSAFRAYRYFAGKFNFSPVLFTDAPDGYPDYSSWLENNCLIFEMRSGGNDYLIPLDAFLRKLIRTIVIFADNYDGKPARIVFNIPDRYEAIVTALQKSRIKVSRENARLLISPDISLDAFLKQLETMPDAGKMIIAGISHYDNIYANISPLILNEAALTGQNFGIRSEVVRLPDQSLNGNDTQIINMLDGKTARYILLIKSDSNREPGIELYRISPYYRISYRGILFDRMTGNSVYSDTVNDVDFSSAPSTGTAGRITVGLGKMISDVLEKL
jgi:hypothetical protein